MRKILLTIAMLSQVISAVADPLQSMPKNSPIQAQRIAFIDTSARSIVWLKNHHRELIDQRIPVMIIGGSSFVAAQLNQQYRGLLIGAEPSPIIHQRLLLKRLGIQVIPSIVDIKSHLAY